MNNAIITGIKDLQDKVSELELDLEIAREQVVFYKTKSGKVPRLEKEVTTLRNENLVLLHERLKVLKTL
jgi:hypothetical protein